MEVLCMRSYVLPPSQNISISRFVLSQTILSLIKFIEKDNNIYDIK
uniref:Uncharacterized protein n=1 Tax=Arundo donax TaxID=35708 RepID=A0A0A9E763_ARUDO